MSSELQQHYAALGWVTEPAVIRVALELEMITPGDKVVLEAPELNSISGNLRGVVLTVVTPAPGRVGQVTRALESAKMHGRPNPHHVPSGKYVFVNEPDDTFGYWVDRRTIAAWKKLVKEGT